MSTPEIVSWAFAAALLFWVVGAYNRLVRLRGALVRQFVPVDEQFRQRHTLLQQQLDALAAVLLEAQPQLDGMRAACRQVETACAHAKVRPGAAGAVTSLRLAEEILGVARAQLPAQELAGIDLKELDAQLAASDATLAFARRQFNDSVTEYNQALQQFPTALLVGLFGFRSAGTL